jgi:hypothetical protein
MEPNMLNKSLPSAETDDSEVLHFGDGIWAGIVYFGSWKLDGLSTIALERTTLQKNTKRLKTGER